MGRQPTDQVELKQCPRCGLPYQTMSRRNVDNKPYLYAIHYFYEGKKRKQRQCYLGPDGAYATARRLLGIELRGLTQINYPEIIEQAIDAITARLELGHVPTQPDIDRLIKASQKLKELIYQLRRPL